MSKYTGLRRAAHVAAVWALVCAISAAARAQRLAVEGDRFAVDGTPRFLTFMSMFGAMGATDIDADLRTIKTLGFDGFRMWPNLYGSLFNSDGTVQPESLARLQRIVERARLEGLIVDVTFTYEHTPGLTPAGDRRAITTVAAALRSYDHVLFDIQNERNVGDRRHMSEAEVASILAAIRVVDPSRIVVASNSPVDSAEYAAAFTTRLGLDATAYHDPRTSSWYTLDTLRRVVGAMKANGRPAYLQEPMPARDSLVPYPSNDRAEYFIQAIAHAKLAGAAAWCFHTDAALDYRTGPARLADRLRAHPEPDWAFVKALRSRAAPKVVRGR